MKPFLSSTTATLSALAAATAASSKEQSLLTTLSSDGELNEKAHACQELAVYGGASSVLLLASLLGDEVLSDYARSALENIDHPSAGAALCEALTQTKGRLLVGVVNSLGVRRDRDAIPALRELVEAGNEVTESAMTSLAMIATEDSIKPIQELLAEADSKFMDGAAHAALLAADQLLEDGNPQAAKALRSLVVDAGGVSDHIRVAARASR